MTPRPLLLAVTMAVALPLTLTLGGCGIRVVENPYVTSYRNAYKTIQEVEQGGGPKLNATAPLPEVCDQVKQAHDSGQTPAPEWGVGRSFDGWYAGCMDAANSVPSKYP